MVTDHGALFVLLFSPLFFFLPSLRARRPANVTARNSADVAAALDGGDIQRDAGRGEAHFDHIHLIYEPSNTSHPRPRTRAARRCRQVKDPETPQSIRGAAGTSEFPPSFPLIWTRQR